MPRIGPAARSPPRPRRCNGSSLKGGVVDRHSNAPSKTGGITSVVGGIRRRPYYSRRCKKVPASSIPTSSIPAISIESLPNEVLSEILVRLSADEIWEKARFVCRIWCRIIHSDAFIDTHVREDSNWGLLLTNLYRAERPLFLGVRQGRVVISELYRSTYFQIAASCNGLVLSIKIPKPYTVNIINLTTKQTLSLPPSIPAGEITHSTFSLGYAAASKVYKVVRAYVNDLKQTICHILTVGVDNKWRCVGIDNLKRGAKKLLLKDPLITQGFMHWTWKWQGTRVLTLNVETEVFTQCYLPFQPRPIDGNVFTRRSLFYLSTGRHLSLLYARKDLAWEVWEMEGESGEWRKLLPNIDLGSHKNLVGFALIEPLGWIKYPVLLGLQSISCCIAYSLDTDEVTYIRLPELCPHYKAVVHRNTLEWLS